jgi:hypothetical protein
MDIIEESKKYYKVPMLNNEWSQNGREIQREPELPAAAESHGCTGLTAFNVVGKISTIIRGVVTFGLIIGVVFSLLVAFHVVQDPSIEANLLYVAAVFGIIGVLMVAFDTATAHWLIEKVLMRLTRDIARLENDLKQFEADLKESRIQLDERNTQLKESKIQIDLRDNQIEKTTELLSKQTLVQNNMKVLLASMMDANAEGVDLNELLSKNIDKLEFLVNGVADTKFETLDQNHDGVISIDEFKLHDGPKSRGLVFNPN